MIKELLEYNIIHFLSGVIAGWISLRIIQGFGMIKNE